MKKTTFVVVSTKGGTGKTIVSSMVLPVLFAGTDKEITVYSIDDNNTIRIKSRYITFKDLSTKDSESVVDEAELKRITNNNDISIIDVGGGADTHIFLKTIKNSVVEGLIYIIPIGDDIEQIDNLIETISEIKNASNDAKIYLILNQVNNLDEDSIKSQFLGIYGSVKYGVDAINEDILDDIEEVYFLEASPIFSILKNIYQHGLLDAFIGAEELLENLYSKKNEWALKGEEYFKKQNSSVRLAQDVIKLTKRIYSMKNIVEE